MSKRDEAVAVENELNVRRKDVEDVQRALDSLSYKEGEMEALQKVNDVLPFTVIRSYNKFFIHLYKFFEPVL